MSLVVIAARGGAKLVNQVQVEKKIRQVNKLKVARTSSSRQKITSVNFWGSISIRALLRS